MKAQELIDSGHITKEAEYEDYTSYTPLASVSIHHDNEEVLSVDIHDDDTVWVTTMQGSDHVGEFDFDINDDIPMEVFVQTNC